MADICKCQDSFCPRKTDCYRFTAEAHPTRQSYFMTSPRSAGERNCEFFFPTEDYAKRPKEDLCSKTSLSH